MVDALDDAQKQWVKLATVWIPNVNTKEVNRLRVAGTLLMMFVADIDTNTDINTNTEQNDEVDLVSDANIIHSSTLAWRWRWNNYPRYAGWWSGTIENG